MAINIGGGGLGAVYLGDTLIAGGGGGGGPSWIAVPVDGTQSSSTESCYFTNGKIGYASCCGFDIFQGCTYFQCWRCGMMVNTGCTIIIPPSSRVFNGVSDDGIRCYSSGIYAGYLRNGTYCACYTKPAGFVYFTLDWNMYVWKGTSPARGRQSYDYIDMVMGCKK